MYNPKYTVGALELYYELTGEDLLFDGGKIDTPLKKKAFLYVGINAGDGDKLGSFDSLNNMGLLEYKDLFELCLNAFNSSFKTEDSGSGKDLKKK